MKQNDLIYQIEKLKETIYICEAEKMSPEALDRLQSKLHNLMKRLSDD